MKDPLCIECGENNADNFYASSKSKCKKCILSEKKVTRENETKKEHIIDDTNYISREDFESMNETLRLHIETLNDRETFDNPNGDMTFREILNIKIDEVDKLNTKMEEIENENDKILEALNNTIEYYEQEIGNMRNEMKELRKIIKELSSKVRIRSGSLKSNFRHVL